MAKKYDTMVIVLTVFGTRPEAIKMAPVIRELQRHPDRFRNIVCVTAQHRQMLDQVLSLFDLKPDFDLNIMKPGQDLYDVTANVLLGLRDVLRQVRPDIFLVHGDTTTTMAASLAGSLGKPVIVMRETTERPEAVAAGTVKLVGTSFERIVTEASLLLGDTGAYEVMSRAHNPYGDGLAAERIASALAAWGEVSFTGASAD